MYTKGADNHSPTRQMQVKIQTWSVKLKAHLTFFPGTKSSYPDSKAVCNTANSACHSSFFFFRDNVDAGLRGDFL
jgi:hypothetical protein